MASLSTVRKRQRIPVTLGLGLAVILAMQALLAYDVAQRGYVVAPLGEQVSLPEPTTAFGHAARWAAFNMTVVCWLAYLAVFDGLLTWLGRRRGLKTLSPLRLRPNRYVVLWLLSIPLWCFFDYVNFSYLHAWLYHGLPPNPYLRTVGYFIAFAAICPGMFLAAQLVLELGLRRLDRPNDVHNRKVAWGLLVGPPTVLWVWAAIATAQRPGAVWYVTLLMPIVAGAVAMMFRHIKATSVAIGLVLTAWAVWVGAPIGNLGLWVGPMLLADPMSGALGGPSLLRDWELGRWSRTGALMAGGAVCGLLWEAWNYWALAKWTYDLPFLGAWESVRYFEMPVVGFLGFLPFAASCWTVLNLALNGVQWCAGGVVEGLEREGDVM